jgi:hypothetical protein
MTDDECRKLIEELFGDRAKAVARILFLTPPLLSAIKQQESKKAKS